MSQPATRVVRVVVSVIMDNGEQFTLTQSDPEPTGNNPAFILTQVTDGIETLRFRFAKLIRATYEGQKDYQ